MLDIRSIRENPETFRQRLSTRGTGVESVIQELCALDEERRRIIGRVETLKAERNRTSKEIGAKMARKEPVEELKAQMKQVADEIAAGDAALAQVEQRQHELLLTTPNVPHDSVPVGDASANLVVRSWGEHRAFTQPPKPHWDLGVARGLIDLEQASRISGSGFVVFKGEGARLERALLNFLLDHHTSRNGYTEVSTPFLVRRDCMVGTGQLPKFEEDMYRLAEEDLYLVPTAEVPVTNLHRDQILAESDLPLRYAAYTPCFRREAGSAGKETRGMIRMHQFDKVELVRMVAPEQSYQALEEMVGEVEGVLQLLGLQYRVLLLSTGDMGFGAAKCYDLEVWAPGTGAWLEVSSCSNFEDFQARRMGLRYKNSEGKNLFCHTLNGSAPALARLFVALLETHQQPDGSVNVPEPLVNYLGCKVL